MADDIKLSEDNQRAARYLADDTIRVLLIGIGEENRSRLNRNPLNKSPIAESGGYFVGMGRAFRNFSPVRDVVRDVNGLNRQIQVTSSLDLSLATIVTYGGEIPVFTAIPNWAVSRSLSV